MKLGANTTTAGGAGVKPGATRQQIGAARCLISNRNKHETKAKTVYHVN